MVKPTHISMEDTYTPQGNVTISNELPIEGSVMEAALQCKIMMDRRANEEKEDQVADAEESLEHLRDSVALLVDSGDWNERTQRFTGIALEGIAIHAGIAEGNAYLAASHTLAGAPVEATVALEAIDDIIAALSEHAQAGFVKLKQSLLASLGHIASAIPHLEDKWRKLEVTLHHEAKSPEGFVKASGFYKRLLKQGEWPRNLSGYLREYVEHVEQIATSFDRKAQEAVIRNADLLASIEYDGVADFDTGYKRAADSWMDPRKELSGSIFEFIVPGGNPFFTTKSTTYKGDNKSIRFFDTFATKNIPAEGRYGSFFQMRKIEQHDKLDPLSLEDMRELCKLFMEATERMKLEQHTASEALAHAQVKVDFFAKRRSTADKDVRSHTREAYRYLDKAYGMTYELGQMKYDVLAAFVKISNAVYTYIERSLKPEQVEEEHPPESPFQE